MTRKGTTWVRYSLSDNESVDRRGFLFGLLSAVAAAAAEPASAQRSLRGVLRTAGEPLLETGGSRVKLTGDEATMLVLQDERLNGSEFEVVGNPLPDGRFDVNRIHTRSLFAIQGGKRLMVTYWCDVCYIRTYSPGKCWCCQKNTDLDLREKLDD